MADKAITITFAQNICGVGAPLHVNDGDDIEWDNQTGDDVILFFPYDHVFGPLQFRFEHKIKKGKKHSPLGKVKDQDKGTSLKYAVYCAINNDFAVGNSNPEIIIDG